jgi:excisionase family DNA binding protein
MRTATADQPEPLLTPEEVADLLKFTRRYVYELMHRGEFGDVIRIGPQAVRITAAGYRAYIERNRVPGLRATSRP